MLDEFKFYVIAVRMVDECLFNQLTLSDEYLESVTSKSDFVDFLGDYTIYFGEDEYDNFKSYVSETKVLNTAVNIDQSLEPAVIGALKHSFTFCRMLDGLIGRGGINGTGIPYLLEANADIEAAIILLSQKYYKHSSQVLRSAIETVIIHLYFTVRKVYYEDLPNCRIPPMNNQKRGMLNYLVNNHYLCLKQSGYISQIYNDLSNAIHSQYKYLQFKFAYDPEVEILASLVTSFRKVASICIMIVMIMDQKHLHD